MSDRLEPSTTPAELERLVQHAIEAVSNAERGLNTALGAAERAMQLVVPPHPPPPPLARQLQKLTELSRECAALGQRLTTRIGTLPHAAAPGPLSPPASGKPGGTAPHA